MMKTAIELLLAWVVISIVIYTGAHLITSYVDGAWLYLMPQTKSDRIGVMAIGVVSIFILGPYARVRGMW